MIKQKQIELLEEKVKKLEGEIEKLIIENNLLLEANEEHRKLNGELRKEIKKLENHKRGMLVELFKANDKIDKAIEIIEPLVEWGECTINGKILKQIYNLLKGDNNV